MDGEGVDDVMRVTGDVDAHLLADVVCIELFARLVVDDDEPSNSKPAHDIDTDSCSARRSVLFTR